MGLFVLFQDVLLLVYEQLPPFCATQRKDKVQSATGMVQYDRVGYGTVRYGKVQYGVVWYCIVCSI